MDEKEELKKKLQQELQWVQYRQKMLVIIEEKLLQMRQLAEHAKVKNLTTAEITSLNAKLNNLASQVKALDEESRKTQSKE